MRKDCVLAKASNQHAVLQAAAYTHLSQGKETGVVARVLAVSWIPLCGFLLAALHKQTTLRRLSCSHM